MAEKFTIGMVLFPNLTQLDFAGPYEVFSRLPDHRVLVLAQTLDPVRSEHGLTLVPDTRFDEAPQLDLLCVPGGVGVNPLMNDQGFLDFLRKQAQQARYVTSVCTGSLLLGAAGLLQGYRATTHWMSMDLLERFGAQPVWDRVVVDRNRITGGGVTAGIDFGLAVAAELCGQTTAEAIQLSIEYNPDPPFNSGSPKTADPALVEKVRARGQVRQDERLKLAEQAAAALAKARR